MKQEPGLVSAFNILQKFMKKSWNFLLTNGVSCVKLYQELAETN